MAYPYREIPPLGSISENNNEKTSGPGPMETAPEVRFLLSELPGCDAVYRFAGTDAVLAIGIAGADTIPVVAGQPPSVPGEGGTPVGGGIPDGVVDDAFPVVGSQLVRPVGVAVGVSDERDNSTSERLYMLLQLFFVYSYRCSRSLGTISFEK